MKLSIIIVHYHVKDFLFKALESLYQSKLSLKFEIIVVDNDEVKNILPDLHRRFPKVRYVSTPENHGYGAGNNMGAKIAKGEYLFFLNPDTIVKQNAVEDLIAFLDKNPKVGIVAPLLLDKNDNFYPLQGTKKLTPLTAVFTLSFINKLFPHNSISKNFWLKDWDKKDLIEVDAVPGTAFLIRKSIFDSINGFDEDFFLFFEEYDVALRVKQLGYKIFILPKAQVFHAWGESTKQKENIEKNFFQSRFLYFKKHYGLLPAYLTSIFLQIKPSHLLLLCILLVGIFLRFYRIEETFIFSGEVGHNLLAIKDAYQSRIIPLIGPPTSHSWLYFGPLYYWIYGPILVLSSFNPLSHAYFGAFISTLTIIANYFVIKKIFNQRIALISSFLLSVSPLYLSFSRGGRFFSIVALLIYPLIYLLFHIDRNTRKKLFWLGVILGCMFSFHFTPLMLVPFIVLILLINKKFSTKNVVIFFGGVFISMIPFFLYDLVHQFGMTSKVLLWLPYRVAGFLGLYPKNTFSPKVAQENVLSLYNFVTESMVTPDQKIVSVIILYGLLLLFIVKCVHAIQKKLQLSEVFLIVWFLCGYIAIFIHGSPPIHYFLPLLPLPILFLSLLLNNLWLKKWGRGIVIAFLLLISVGNFRYLFSDKWFFYPENKMTTVPYYIPYKVQKEVTRVIVSDAKTKRFNLRRVGLYDQFEGDYAQNYIYLLWLYGNEPTEKQQKITYTIYEDTKK